MWFPVLIKDISNKNERFEDLYMQHIHAIRIIDISEQTKIAEVIACVVVLNCAGDTVWENKSRMSSI